MFSLQNPSGKLITFLVTLDILVWNASFYQFETFVGYMPWIQFCASSTLLLGLALFVMHYFREKINPFTMLSQLITLNVGFLGFFMIAKFFNIPQLRESLSAVVAASVINFLGINIGLKGKVAHIPKFIWYFGLVCLTMSLIYMLAPIARWACPLVFLVYVRILQSPLFAQPLSSPRAIRSNEPGTST